MLIVGIDPGKNTGFAVYDFNNKKFLKVTSTTFWQAVDWLRSIQNGGIAVVAVIEVPNTNAVFHKGATNRGAIEGTARRVGGVLREAHLWLEFVSHYELDHAVTQPMGKVKAKEFKLVSGWEGRTNQHGRDAGMMCLSYIGL